MASVLVAEDNVDHRRAITQVLRRWGHDVTAVADGRAALAAIAGHRPDVVVADVVMPELDGLELCRAIRRDPALAGVPVVLVSALLSAGDPRPAAVGAAATVHKPFDFEELATALTSVLKGTEPAADGGVAARVDAVAGPGFTEALLHSLNIGVAACDPSGRLVLFNQFLRDVFGDEGSDVPVPDWPQRFMLRHHDGTPLGADELPLARALAGEHVDEADLLAYDRQGHPHWFAINARPVRDAVTGLRGAVAAVHDITSEYRGRRYQNCKTRVLDILSRGLDPAAVGDQVVEAVGTSLGWPYVRLWLPDPVTDLMRPAATHTAAGEQPPAVPTSTARGHGLAGLCWQQGSLLWVPDIHAPGSPVLPDVAASTSFRAAGAVPLLSGDTVTGVLTFFSHSPQEPEPALEVLLTGMAGNIGAYLEQRRNDELRMHLAAITDEYISLVGHDLRTPLTSIGAYTQLIAESPDATTVAEIRPLIDVVERNNHRLRTLIEQLLDLAALETGHATTICADVDLAELAAVAAGTATAAAEDRAITVTAHLPEALVVTGDPDRLRQVCDNLLDNAVKFSPDHSTVALSLVRDGDAAVLTVTDDGIGIPTDEHPHLFRRLYRASNARHTAIPGTGLGLALTRAVVERHHGTITLAGRRPTGTTVTVRLPIGQPRH
jgi:PAS domain S-box-containing protein